MSLETAQILRPSFSLIHTGMIDISFETFTYLLYIRLKIIFSSVFKVFFLNVNRNVFFLM